MTTRALHVPLPALLAALSLPVFFSACVFGDDAPPREPIVPLAIGNTWAYVDSAYVGSDSVTVDSTRIDVTGMRTVTVGGMERTVYVWNVRDRATGQPGALSLWLRDAADGNYTVGAVQDTASFLFETLHVKYPAVRGERYPTQFLSFRADGGALIPVVDTVEIEVVNLDTTCVTPAGSFACVHYRGRDSGILFADAYYAPGIGFLGSESRDTVPVNGTLRPRLFTRRLAAYTLH
jgi:hypothetical protein